MLEKGGEKEPFTPLSHQSLPKNGYEPPEYGNFDGFCPGPSAVHQSYPPHLNFTSFPTNFLTQSRPRNRRCLPEKLLFSAMNLPVPLSSELALALVVVGQRCCCSPRRLPMLIAWSSLARAVEGEREQRAFADWRDERETAICLTILAGEETGGSKERRDEKRKAKRGGRWEEREGELTGDGGALAGSH
ncbi:hypothetical protein H5410_023199 [Solanum commersonii]|uniref:Uncharacterized protein n=1 Tax=Solanum commersonii TaxID=4109 RepID=A0A9J5ZJZ2_SOLCO|nr:hypothetical protein H5410_023199 [Solanum commersonii]